MLQKATSGDPKAVDELLPLVYGELKGLARQRLARLQPGQTLQATALVHDAWLKLGNVGAQAWDSRAHFFGAAARAMRNILVDQARRKAHRKVGGDPDELGELNFDDSKQGPGLDLLALHEALTKLEAEHERPARVVMLRFFTGLSLEEIGTALDVSTRTVDREWRFARDWLRRALEPGGD